MPVYTYTQYLADCVDTVKGANVSSALNVRNLLNRSVREVLQELDLRSTKRKSALAPNLFDDIYDYSFPADGKSLGVIDLNPQVNRAKDSEIILITPEEFERRKTSENNLIAIMDKDFIRKLKASIHVDDDELVISQLDSLTSGGGTWVLFGDGTNLRADSDNFIKGSASISWDISAAGGTTAGIQNLGLNVFDLTNYIYAGSIFAWVYIQSTTNLTNFILRVGIDGSNYYTKTVTVVNEGTSFVNGWNLLRFDLASSSKVGTVDLTKCKYCAIYMTKDGAKISETNYRFDWIVAKRGKIYELLYYSKYGWQTASGTYIENSTVVGDLLNADTEEYDIFVARGRMNVFRELKDWTEYKIAQGDYMTMVKNYKMMYPSERKWISSMYYDIGSIK